MSEAEKTGLFRSRWNIGYLLLMVLPGIVFLTAYPILDPKYLHAARQEYEQATPEEQSQMGSSAVIRPAVSASSLAGLIAAGTLLIAGPFLLRKAAPKGELGLAEAIAAGIFLIILNGSLAFAGCSLGALVTRESRSTLPVPKLPSAAGDGVWRASEEHGDKPGVGIEIRRSGESVSCSMFLLDPSWPHDFTRGHERPVSLTTSQADTLEFTVRWNDRQTDHLRLVLPDGIGGVEFRGILSNNSLIKDPNPTAFVFRRAE